MKKSLVFIASIISLLTACGQNTSTTVNKPDNSGLKGEFNSTEKFKNYVARTQGAHFVIEDVGTYLDVLNWNNLSPERKAEIESHAADIKVDNRNIQFLESFPLVMGGNPSVTEYQQIWYNVEQKLLLKRNYTYTYTYNIHLGSFYIENSSDNILELSVKMEGTYSYRVADIDNSDYLISLSNPTSGYERIYGSLIPNKEANIFWKWTKSTNPTYEVDFEKVGGSDSFTYDSYTNTRTLKVHLAEEKEYCSVQADYYDAHFLNNMSKYCIY